MAPLLKDAGLDGCRGSVQHCPECRRATVHFRWPGGLPVCGWCGALSNLLHLRQRSAARDGHTIGGSFPLRAA